jgi:phosphohistidine phosphatase
MTKPKASAAKTATKEPAPVKPDATKPDATKPAATKRAEASSAESKPVTRGVAAMPAETSTPAGLELYLLRHADAGDPATWTGDDAERPLSSKGRRQAKRLGRLLKDLDARPDAVLTSPKRRASETARLVARSIGAQPSIDERLSVDFGGRELAAIVAGLEPKIRGVMLVGHDPDFSAVLSWLAGCDLEMRKGALARIDLPDREVGAGRGSLRWLLPPDAVPG